MAGHHYIYLIPGFFGFADLGGITYFHHVREHLEDLFTEIGVKVEIIAVPTLPTASIRRRASLLLETIEKTATDPDASIHLVGHSTGGLDARLLVTPNVTLVEGHNHEEIARRVRSVITISTPHRGTPLASFFGSLLGKKALWALSLGSIYTLRFGRLPLSVLFRLVGVVARMDNHLGMRSNILDQVYHDLLADFDAEREAIVTEFMENVRHDQSLLRQLTPEGIDLFNASTSDRPGVNYASVLTMARRPGLRTTVEQGLNPYDHASHGLYRALWWMSSRSENYPLLRDEWKDAIQERWDIEPTSKDSDGMVPTLSQPWGTVIHAALADHLDVCGHFDGPDHDPPHVDWVSTGSGFTRAAFEHLWQDVATFIAQSARTPKR